MIDNRSMELVGYRTLLAYTLKLIEASQRIGMKINEEKTKYMIMTRQSTNKISI